MGECQHHIHSRFVVYYTQHNRRNDCTCAGNLRLCLLRLHSVTVHAVSSSATTATTVVVPSSSAPPSKTNDGLTCRTHRERAHCVTLSRWGTLWHSGTCNLTWMTRHERTHCATQLTLRLRNNIGRCLRLLLRRHDTFLHTHTHTHTHERTLNDRHSQRVSSSLVQMQVDSIIHVGSMD